MARNISLPVYNPHDEWNCDNQRTTGTGDQTVHKYPDETIIHRYIYFRYVYNFYTRITNNRQHDHNTGKHSVQPTHFNCEFDPKFLRIDFGQQLQLHTIFNTW